MPAQVFRPDVDRQRILLTLQVTRSEVAVTMSMTSPPSQGRLEELEAALEDVRASRPAASRVVAMTNDPRCDAADIAAVIDTDPLLTTQILRLANSAAYGMSERVGNTQVAVGLVGFSAVRSIAVLLASGLRNHKTPPPPGFWAHAAASGAACAVLSSRFGVARGDAFSLGLMHDIGSAVIHTVDPVAHQAMLEDESDNGALCVLELLEFGMSHADAAARVLAGWNFPEGFVSAVGRHHEMTRGTTPLEQVLLAGDAIAHLVAEGDAGDPATVARLTELDIPVEMVPTLTTATREYAAEVMAGLPI
jgi:HD-like signal output (HDOD) protein